MTGFCRLIFPVILAASLRILGADAPDARLSWLISLKLIEMPSGSAPVVRVPIGSTTPAGEKPRVRYALGFLDEDRATGSLVRLADFSRLKIDRTTGEQYGLKPEDTVRRLSGLEAAKLWIDWLDMETADQRRSRTYGEMEEFAQMIVLAAVFRQRGESEAAELLHRRALTLKRNGVGAWPDDRDFDRDLREQIAGGLLRAASFSFADLNTPRLLLARRLDQIIRHFSDTQAAAEAAPLAQSLQVVIGADAQSAKTKLTGDALARLPVKERIAALIRQLPDQTGRQLTLPGSCNIFANDPAVSSWRMMRTDGTEEKQPPAAATTPAGKLLQIGMEAVPQLLEAIDDRRPTRAVDVSRSSGQRSNVLDVGDCVLQILERLSGRWFYERNPPDDPDVARAGTKRNASAWWQGVSSGGEAEALDKEISAGGGETGLGNLPARLAQIAPDLIVGAIERGLASTEKSWDAETLVEVLATLDAGPARALMRKVVAHGRFLNARICAARFLFASGSSENDKPLAPQAETDHRMAVAAMLQEWKSFPGSSERRGPRDGGALAGLLAHFALSDSSIFPMLNAELPRHLPDNRAYVIKELSNLLHSETIRKKHAANAMLERYLAGQLDDVAFAPDIYLQRNPQVHAVGARVAEFAADLLHQLWPGRYVFTLDATPAEIERARLACLNAWRATQKLPPLAPAPPLLGEHEDPSTVTTVTLGKTSRELPPELKKLSDALLRKPLSGDGLVRFLVAQAAANAGDTQSLRITATRADARSGFAVEITLASEREPTANGNSHLGVHVGDRTIMGSSGGMELRHAMRTDLSSYVRFKEGITEALAAPASTIVFIRAMRLAQNAEL